MTLHYRFVTWLIYCYLKLFRGLRIRGQERIPPTGAVIFAPNHISNMDPFVVAAATDKAMGYFAKKELFFFPLGPIIRAFGAFPVDRSGNATAAVRTAIRMLSDGWSLTIFPEGTRNRTSRLLLPPKRGVSLIAKQTGAPVVPVAIRGSRGFTGRICIEFGQPIVAPTTGGGAHTPDKAHYAALPTQLMDTIRDMLTDQS